MLDDILEVNRHNERVLRIQEIVETSFEPIRERIEEIVGTELDRLTHEQSPADSCSGAPGSTRTRRRPPASPTRPTSAAR